MYISPDASPGDGLSGARHASAKDSWVIEEESESDSGSKSHVILTEASQTLPEDSLMSYYPLHGDISPHTEYFPEPRPVYRALSAFAITDDDSIPGSVEGNAVCGTESTDFVSSERALHRKIDSADSSCTDISHSDSQGRGGALSSVAAWKQTYMPDADPSSSERHATLPQATATAAIIDTSSKASVH